MEKLISTDELIKRYDDGEESHITQKQVDYVQRLYNSIEGEGVRLEFKEKVEQLDNLREEEIYTLIENLKKKCPPSIYQTLLLLTNFDDFEGEGQKWTSFREAEIILSGPDKFRPWIREHPITCQDEWEHGWQESDKCKNGKLYYLKFYNMMMLDFDFGQDKHAKYEDLKKRLKLFKGYKFRLYQTHNGYHVFIISELIKYNDPLVLTITKKLNADLYYSMFAAKTGFKIRLSKKIDREEEYIFRYIEEVGSGRTNEICERLIKIHDGFYIKN